MFDAKAIIERARSLSPPKPMPPVSQKVHFGAIPDAELERNEARLRRSKYVPIIHTVLSNRKELDQSQQRLEPLVQADSSTDTSLNVKVTQLTTFFSTPDVSEEWVDFVFELMDFFGNCVGSYPIQIKRADIRQRLFQKLSSRYPQLLLGAEADEIVRIASSAYGRALRTAPHGYKFFFSGWFFHPEKKRYVFLNNALPGVESKVRLEHNIDAARQFPADYLDMAAPSAIGKLVVTLLFAAWAPLAFFYEKAGIAASGLRCALFLNAPTGTGKTTLAKIFADAITVTPEDNVLRFDDTIASLQEGILARIDTVCVVDDLYPQGTAREEAAFRTKLVEITRIAGDGRVKGKMGPDRKPLPDRRYRGTLMCTGEYYELTTQSSYLRCWHVHLPSGSINYESAGLAELSRHPEIAHAFMSGWIEYIEGNQATILKELPDISRSTLEYVRRLFPDCAHTRSLNNICALLVVVRLLARYLQQLTNDARFSEDVLLTLVQQEAAEQLDYLTQIAPEQIFEDALRDAIDSGVLLLSGDESDFISNTDSAGFVKEDRAFVISSRAEEAIMAFCRKKSLGLRITMDLKESLLRRGTLIAAADGSFTMKYSKNRRVVPKRPRLYMLPARMVEERM